MFIWLMNYPEGLAGFKPSVSGWEKDLTPPPLHISPFVFFSSEAQIMKGTVAPLLIRESLPDSL